MRIRFLLPLLLLVAAGTAHAQAQEVQLSPRVIASAGGQGTVDNVTIMWTVGEVAVTTLQGSGFYLTQGFHQPADNVTSVPEVPIADLGVSLYPNPASSQLFVEGDASVAGSVRLELVDMLGRVVGSYESSEGTAALRVDLGSMQPGAYVARITRGELTASRVVIVQQ